MKHIGIVRTLLIILGLLLFYSCATHDKGAGYIPEIRQINYDTDYFHNLNRERYFQKSFNEYYSLFPQGKAGPQWEELYEEILQGMREEWESSLEQKNFPLAFSLYRSLDLLGEGDILSSQEEGKGELLNKAYLQYLIDQGYAAALSSWFFDNPQGEYSQEQISRLRDFFIENDQRSALTKLEPLLNERGELLSQEGRDLMNQSVEKEDMLNGTVTIWVNKGIKLEGGVGYPDRVIGSGFFIDPHGYILTNYHVITSEVDPTYEGYSRLYVKLNENKNEKVPAKVIGWDPVLDLALLKTEITSPYVFSFSASNQYNLGDRIFAIGSPGGLTNSVTSGTISNTERNLQALGKSLQIDVPINPGNSGGPLINEEGEVIGVVYAGIEEYEGVNFAIPASYVKSLLPRLYQGGTLAYSWLGAVVYRDFNNLVIRYIVPDSNADLSGLQEGDFIRSINGISVKDITDIQDILMNAFPKELIKIEIQRKGENRIVYSGLKARPESPMKVLLSRDSIDHLYAPLFGMKTVRTNANPLSRQYRIEEVFPGSIADESGLVTGDTFTLNSWINNDELEVVIIQIIIKARKSGFMQSGLQMGTWYRTNNFI